MGQPGAQSGGAQGSLSRLRERVGVRAAAHRLKPAPSRCLRHRPLTLALSPPSGGEGRSRVHAHVLCLTNKHRSRGPGPGPKALRSKRRPHIRWPRSRPRQNAVAGVSPATSVVPSGEAAQAAQGG